MLMEDDASFIFPTLINSNSYFEFFVWICIPRNSHANIGQVTQRRESALWFTLSSFLSNNDQPSTALIRDLSDLKIGPHTIGHQDIMLEKNTLSEFHSAK